MDKTPDDFWELPEEPPTIETPKEILTAQAGFLEKHTKGVLSGLVSARTDMTGREMLLSFKIYAPSIPSYAGTYQIELFDITHPITTIYPATIEGTVIDRAIICASPEEFKQELRKILSSTKTRNVISSLLNLSR